MLKGFHSNRESGMSLVSVLMSLGIMGVSAAAATSWLGQYQAGRAKLNASSSIGEVERVLLASVSDSLREYSRRGCTPKAYTDYLIKAKKVADNDDPKKRGEIQLITNASKITIPSGFGPGVSCQSNLAVATGTPMSSCFQYRPTNTSPSASKKNKSILDASLVFVTISSEIIDLRTGKNQSLATGATLTCADLKDKSGLTKCSKPIADLKNKNKQLCASDFFESSYPGGGIRHRYTIYWQIGPSGKANFNKKSGVVYVAN